MKNYILKNFKYKNFRLIRIKKFNEKKLNILIKKLFIYFTGHNLIRIGNQSGDGGYLVPDLINDIDYCFSPGTGSQTGFEDELLCKYNIKSHGVRF